MSNQLPYKHIQEQTERQLLNIIVDKLYHETMVQLYLQFFLLTTYINAI